MRSISNNCFQHYILDTFVDVVSDSLQTITDNLTFRAHKSSLVLITLIMILCTSSVGNSFSGKAVGEPRITLRVPLTERMNVTSIFTTFDDASLTSLTTAPSPGNLITNDTESSVKLTPLLIKSSFLVTLGETSIRLAATNVLINSISTQGARVVVP